VKLLQAWGTGGVLIVTVVVPVIYGGKEGGRIVGLYGVLYKNSRYIHIKAKEWIFGI